MELVVLIAFILSLYSIIKLRQIESKIDSGVLSKPLSPQNTSIPVSSLDPAKVQRASPQPVTEKRKPTAFESLWAWYSHEWPLKTGALFILLGFVWLVSYAFLNNWIGPVGRITLGLVVGTLTLYFGDKRIRKVRTQGITLVGLGAGIIVITVYAAQYVYQMFHPLVALGFIGLTMVLSARISLQHSVKSLAVFSLILGAIAPAVIGAEEKSILGLYGYLMAVTVGVIWIARFSRWRILSFLSLIMVTIYSIEYFIGLPLKLSSLLTPQQLFELQFVAVTFSSLFYFSTLASIITNRTASTYDLITAAAGGLFSLGWINGLVSAEYKGIVTLLVVMFYTFGAYAVFVKTKIPSAVQVYTAVAMILLAVATGFEFEGPVLAIAFSIEALVLPIIAARYLGASMAKYTMLYFILPFLLSLDAVGNTWHATTFIKDFSTLTIVTFAFLGSGIYFYYNEGKKDAFFHNTALVITILGGIYGLVWVWKLLGYGITSEYFARMAALFIYTVVGLFTYASGEVNQRSIMKKFGLGVLIFVIGRLLIVEVWDMALTARIITFFLIGLLFMGSVLLKKSKPAHV